MNTFAVVSVCHNDGPLLAHFIEHYRAQGASRLLILDHDSTDGAVTNAAQRWPYFVSVETIPLRPEVDGLDDRWRCDAHQRLREKCIGQFNWCIMPDADEFVVSKTRGETIRDALARYPAETVLGTEGYDVIERLGDAPIDWSKPILPQRQFGYPNQQWYSKPIVLKSNGPERLAVGHHNLVGRPRPALAPFFLFHLAAIDKTLYLERRLTMCRRQSHLNGVVRGHAPYYNASQTRETLLARFRALQALPLQPLPLNFQPTEPPAVVTTPEPAPVFNDGPPWGLGGLHHDPVDLERMRLWMEQMRQRSP